MEHLIIESVNEVTTNFAITPLLAVGIGALGKGIFGGINMLKGRKKQKEAEEEQMKLLEERKKAYQEQQSGIADVTSKGYEYGLPKETMDYLQLLKSRAGRTRMPGQDILEQRVESTGAGAIQDIISAGGGRAGSMAAISNLSGTMVNQLQDLAVKSAQYRAEREAEAGIGMYQIGQMREMGKQRELQRLTREMERVDPYSDTQQFYGRQYEAGAQQKGFGRQLVTSGLSDIGMSGIYQSEEWSDLLKRKAKPQEQYPQIPSWA